MNKKITLSKRETVLLLILVVLLLGFGYFKLIHQPVANGIKEAQERQSTAETQLLIEAGKLSQMKKMEQELDELITAEGEDAFELPRYDNMRHVMIQLNTILSASQEYSLTFGELRFGEHGLVSRPIQMEFTADNYEVARMIIEQLHNCPFRCRVSDINISAEGKESISYDCVNVSLTVTFFEQAE
jgi:Tfp pilus assembly protein PilO